MLFQLMVNISFSNILIESFAQYFCLFDSDEEALVFGIIINTNIAVTIIIII